MKKTILTAFLFITLIQFSFSQVPSQSTDVMLQSFSWDSYTSSKWTNIQNQSDEISTYFSLVWLPPSGKHGGGNQMGYLPMYYFNQNSSFGTQAELISLISTLKAKGVKSIADIVINHRVGVTNWVDFPSETYNGTTYTWGMNTICSDDKVCDCSSDCSAYSQKPTGNNDTGICYGAARDIDHTNTTVQNTIKAYLNFMKNDIGYSGWRYDFAKGYSGKYTNIYNNSLNGYISIGENYDFSYTNVLNWITQTGYTSMAFDFPLKEQLNTAFNSGTNYNCLAYQNGSELQPNGLLRYDKGKYAVTFVDNHDTGGPAESNGSNPVTKNILGAYAFILSHPGIPCVCWEHWNNSTYKLGIQCMINGRKLIGINSESAVTINQANTNSYVATITGSNGTLMLKLGSGVYSIPSDYSLVLSGSNFELWKKANNIGAERTANKNTALIYPNPARDVLNIVCKDDADKIEITNNIGIELKSTTEISDFTSIDISTLPSGMYLVNVYYKNGTKFTKRIVKN